MNTIPFSKSQRSNAWLVFSVVAILGLNACGSDQPSSSANPAAANAGSATVQASGARLNGSDIAPGLELDLTCDRATYPSATLLKCELANVAKTLEANLEQLNPLFVSRQLQQMSTNTLQLLGRSLNDPSWVLPPAYGNTGITPLCAAGSGPCVGDPFRYPGVDGPDGKKFYEEEAEVIPVVYYDQGCARISGQVWRPRNTDNQRLPAVVIKNGSVQAGEALYWWAAQELVRAGYMVLTGDPRGQGLSDFSTPTGEQGGNFNGAVFFEGLVNDIDFLMSSPSQPYPHEQTCAGTYPTKTAAFNPFHALLDPNRIGAAGHSYGAGGVTWVQSYDAPGGPRWPGLISSKNPVKAIVAWDALGSSITPSAATATSLAPNADTLNSPLLEFAARPAGAPPVVPRVPALGFNSEYGFTPVPFVRDVPRDEHLQAYKEWSAARQPVFNITIAGSTHLDYSLGPALPASSWCPEIVNNACSGGWARPMITHYTVAWFDRFLKRPGENGFDDADARLLQDAKWAERMSFHFASARRFNTRDGRLVSSNDIRMDYPRRN
ncbi:MAG TPA: hypothetical protein VFV28_02965 [Limnobacter sp.]|nr:hypothetical protein [Limnobacter sp.]